LFKAKVSQMQISFTQNAEGVLKRKAYLFETRGN